MATLTTQRINRAGLSAPTYAAAAAGGDSFTPGSNVFLHFKNTNAAARVVTFVTPRDVIPNVGTVDITRSIPATTGDVMVGPFPASVFAQADDGLADMTYDAVTNLTVAVIEITQP